MAWYSFYQLDCRGTKYYSVAVIRGAVTKAHFSMEACGQNIDVFRVRAKYGRLCDYLPLNSSIRYPYRNWVIVDVWTQYQRWSYCNWRWPFYWRRLAGLAGRQESLLCYRVRVQLFWMMDTKTCLIEQQNDPAWLRKARPGKLDRLPMSTAESISRRAKHSQKLESRGCIYPSSLLRMAGPNSTSNLDSLEPGDIPGILMMLLAWIMPNRLKVSSAAKGVQALLAVNQTLDTYFLFRNSTVLIFRQLWQPLSKTSSLFSGIQNCLCPRYTPSLLPCLAWFPLVGGEHSLYKLLGQGLYLWIYPLACFYCAEKYRGGMKRHGDQCIASLFGRYRKTFRW